MGWEKDLPPGEKLVICFRTFLEHLVGSDLAANTILKHVDNMWCDTRHSTEPAEGFLVQLRPDLRTGTERQQPHTLAAAGPKPCYIPFPP